jgi:hypothetical protein
VANDHAGTVNVIVQLGMRGLSFVAVAAATALVALGGLGISTGVPAARKAAIRPGGINAEPSMRPWRYSGANPDGWWCRPAACNGVANGTVFVERELRLISRLRAKRLRLEFPWPLIEPRPNSFEWGRADYIVKRARHYRVRLLPVLLYTPPWDAPDANDPPQTEAYKTFVRAFAHRYRAFVDAYELWNEPDLERYWTGGPQEYVNAVLRPGYRAVKAEDPRAHVVLGGPASADLEWLNDVYRFGGGGSFDTMSFHDYSGDSQILDHARLVQDLLRTHRQARKPIWLTEYGLQEAGQADVRQQALIRLVLTGRAPIALAAWYSLRDDAVMSCCPPATIKNELYGLVMADYRPKDAYRTMKRLLR